MQLNAKMKFKTREMEKQIECNVFSCLRTDLILGSDFLQRYNVKIDYKNRIIEIQKNIYDFSNCNNDYSSEYEQQRVDSVDVNIILKEGDVLEKIIIEAQKNKPKIGLFPNVEHQINLTSSPDKKLKPYPIPYGLYQATKDEIQRLLKNKIIRKSSSTICSPAYPIAKKDGSIRLINDFRHLNKHTMKEYFPIPNIYDILRSIEKANYFTKIDLDKGFYQIRLREEDKYKPLSFYLGDSTNTM